MYCSNCGTPQPPKAEYCCNCAALVYYMPSAVEKQKKADTDLILQIFMIIMMIFATLGIFVILGVIPENLFELVISRLSSQ